MNKQITGQDYSKNFGQIVSAPSDKSGHKLAWAVVTDDNRLGPVFVSEPITWAGLSFKRAAALNAATTDELTISYVVEAPLADFFA